MNTVVIVGAGQAGSELAVSLRQNGFSDRVILLGAENFLPYQRPPLSKNFLLGKIDEEALHIRARDAYVAAGVELELDASAIAIDRQSRMVTVTGGRKLRYDKLAITTGGRPRIHVAGGGRPLGQGLHTLENARALRQDLSHGGRILVVGGGFIGLEVASAAIQLGLEVTLVEAEPRVLARNCPPVVSEFFEREHRAKGVDLRTGVSVRRVVRRQQALFAELTDGTVVRSELLVSGVGIAANDALAANAGLAVDEGIVVDALARTVDPDVVAAGDCTRQWHGFLDQRIRLESVQNATDQARIAAATLCGKRTESFAPPWFWSDQYEHKLQIVGLPHSTDTVVLRGDPATNSFSVVYLREGVIAAMHSLNRPRDFVAGRQLVAARTPLAARDAAADDSPLSAFRRESANPVERKV